MTIKQRTRQRDVLSGLDLSNSPPKDADGQVISVGRNYKYLGGYKLQVRGKVVKVQSDRIVVEPYRIGPRRLVGFWSTIRCTWRGEMLSEGTE